MPLVQPTDDTLTVRQVSAHLRVEEYAVTRELNRGKREREAAGLDENDSTLRHLQGDKVTGPGNQGQGGSWRVTLTNYYRWLGVSKKDARHKGPGNLVLLYTFDEVARQYGLPDAATVHEIVQRCRHAYLEFGTSRYLTAPQLMEAEEDLQAAAQDTAPAGLG